MNITNFVIPFFIGGEPPAETERMVAVFDIEEAGHTTLAARLWEHAGIFRVTDGERNPIDRADLVEAAVAEFKARTA